MGYREGRPFSEKVGSGRAPVAPGSHFGSFWGGPGSQKRTLWSHKGPQGIPWGVQVRSRSLKNEALRPLGATRSTSVPPFGRPWGPRDHFCSILSRFFVDLGCVFLISWRFRDRYHSYHFSPALCELCKRYSGEWAPLPSELSGACLYRFRKALACPDAGGLVESAPRRGL